MTATLRVGRLDLVERTGAPQAGGMVRYDVEFGVGGISVWGEAIPNWISAVGGLIATLVALVAFFQGRSNRDGLEEVKSVENARANTGVGQGGVRGSRRVELREDGSLRRAGSIGGR